MVRAADHIPSTSASVPALLWNTLPGAELSCSVHSPASSIPARDAPRGERAPPRTASGPAAQSGQGTFSLGALQTGLQTGRPRRGNWGVPVENRTRGARRLHAAGLAAGALPSPFQPKFHSGPRGAASPPALHNPQPQAGNAGSPQGSSRRWGCSPGPGLARAPGGRGLGG